jgi:hypothetical protein
MIFGSAFIGPGRAEADDTDGCLGADMSGVTFRGESKMMTDDYDGFGPRASAHAMRRRTRGGRHAVKAALSGGASL